MNRLYFQHDGPHRAVLTNMATGQRWNQETEALETHASSNWSDYQISPTRIGVSRDWFYEVPSGLPDGSYMVAVYEGTDPEMDDFEIGGASFRWREGEVLLGTVAVTDAVPGLPVGPGGIPWTIQVNDPAGNPIDGAAAWVTSDPEGDHVIAGALMSDINGLVTFMLEAGDFFFWRQKGTRNFPNPIPFTVTE